LRKMNMFEIAELGQTLKKAEYNIHMNGRRF
jgi:hypothetical protein